MVVNSEDPIAKKIHYNMITSNEFYSNENSNQGDKSTLKKNGIEFVAYIFIGSYSIFFKSINIYAFGRNFIYLVSFSLYTF